MFVREIGVGDAKARVLCVRERRYSGRGVEAGVVGVCGREGGFV